MFYFVDRITPTGAVLEPPEGPSFTAPPEQLAPGVREGDVVRLRGGLYHTDTGQTQARRARIAALLGRLGQKGKE